MVYYFAYSKINLSWIVDAYVIERGRGCPWREVCLLQILSGKDDMCLSNICHALITVNFWHVPDYVNSICIAYRNEYITIYDWWFIPVVVISVEFICAKKQIHGYICVSIYGVIRITRFYKAVFSDCDGFSFHTCVLRMLYQSMWCGLHNEIHFFKIQRLACYCISSKWKFETDKPWWFWSAKFDDGQIISLQQAIAVHGWHLMIAYTHYNHILHLMVGET